MFIQQSDKSAKGIQSVEAFSADQGGVVVLLSDFSVGQVHAHLQQQAVEGGSSSRWEMPWWTLSRNSCLLQQTWCS